ncbi:MAG: DUF4294 domain-containing protein [Bacteroidales bacterium]|nr:DUF4294 domain-containing protein [Bacteroidales bacterium]
MSFRRHIVLLLALLTFGPMAAGQGHVRRAMERAKQRQEEMARKEVAADEHAASQGAGYMRMLVAGGDTTYLDNLRPVYVFGQKGKKSEKSWREYYTLVWRFARVYPYALASGGLKHQVDSTLNARKYGGIRRQMYIDAIQKQLFKDFGGALHDMTISQGALLLKLIGRETGFTPYDIIHDYKSGVAAGFWQGVAKLFDNDLKSQYDPDGADAAVEQLVQIWLRGDFPALYWSIFWEDPPVVKVPETYFK